MKPIFSFKSEPEFYDKEVAGWKPNTVREVDMSDERFRGLAKWDRKERNWKIRIVRSRGLPVASFEREIQDVSWYKNLCIITWRHK